MSYEMNIQGVDDRFRQVVRIDDVKFCEFMNGTKKNTLVQWLIDMTGKSLKRSLHPCPYVVRILQITFDNL